MTGLFYSSYQMVCLFLLSILENNLEKTRQDNVYLVFYSDNKYMSGSSKQTCKRFYLPFFVFHNDACSTN